MKILRRERQIEKGEERGEEGRWKERQRDNDRLRQRG